MEGSAPFDWREKGTGRGLRSPVRETNVTGRRAAAFLVDNAIATAPVLLALAPPLILLSVLAPAAASASRALASLVVGLVLVAPVFGVFVGYYAFFEVRRGQTPGKMLFGIEVIREDDGGTPGWKAAALRVLLLMVADGLLFCVVGFAAIVLSGKHQRLGDMVANTLVVRKEQGLR